LTVDIFHGLGDEGLARLERAFALTVAAQPLRDRLHKAHIRDVEKARQEGLITEAEAGGVRAAAHARSPAGARRAFAPRGSAPRQAAAEDVNPVKWNPFKRQPRSRRSSLAGGW